MREVDLLNKILNTNYNNYIDFIDSEEVLGKCLNDERLYSLIRRFNDKAWSNSNQELFASIIPNYVGRYYTPNIKKITSPNLLTQIYKYSINGLYYYATSDALNYENVKLAYDKNIYNAFLFRESQIALKVYLENNYSYNIDF